MHIYHVINYQSDKVMLMLHECSDHVFVVIYVDSNVNELNKESSLASDNGFQ
jgi:hypothetical protein